MEESLSVGTWVLLLLPVVLIQVGLQIYALVDLVRRPMARSEHKVLWGLLIVCTGLIGPVLYLLLGRSGE
jgi:ABC-type tungstate transport system substrate-binding protein